MCSGDSWMIFGTFTTIKSRNMIKDTRRPKPTPHILATPSDIKVLEVHTQKHQTSQTLSRNTTQFSTRATRPSKILQKRVNNYKKLKILFSQELTFIQILQSKGRLFLNRNRKSQKVKIFRFLLRKWQ